MISRRLRDDNESSRFEYNMKPNGFDLHAGWFKPYASFPVLSSTYYIVLCSRLLEASYFVSRF